MKVCIIGCFGFGENLTNGQTIKTKIVKSSLVKIFGENEIHCVDTYNAKYNITKLLLKIFISFIYCKNVIILPAHNGLRIIAPVCTLLNFIFHRKLHYIVIGGWLPQFLKKRQFLTFCLKKFDYIYVETNTMKQALCLSNVEIMPNFKDIKVLLESELVYNHERPYKLCTFSRVMKEKGIEDAIYAVKAINEKYDENICCLDIYGPVDMEQQEWFDNLMMNVPTYIKYKGIVDADKSVDVLKKYYLLLFPTRFFTEGIPGTILDAYAAGVPVLASKWESFHDIIDKGVTGYGFEYKDVVDFQNKLEMMLQIDINPIKEECILKSKQYLPDQVIKNIIRKLM